MPYNRYIGYPAPLPSGALPTDEELSALIRQSRRRQFGVLTTWFRRLVAH